MKDKDISNRKYVKTPSSSTPAKRRSVISNVWRICKVWILLKTRRLRKIWGAFSKITAGCTSLLSAQIYLLIHASWPLAIRIILFILLAAASITAIYTAILSMKKIKLYTGKSFNDVIISITVFAAITSPFIAVKLKTDYVNSLIHINQQCQLKTIEK